MFINYIVTLYVSNYFGDFNSGYVTHFCDKILNLLINIIPSLLHIIFVTITMSSLLHIWLAIFKFYAYLLENL